MKQQTLIFQIISFCLILSFSSFALAQAPQASAAQLFRYQVKGKIISLPNPTDLKPEIKIRHEKIPDYVDETGAKVGMGAMTMSFHVSKDVNLLELSEGDKIEFTLESWWKPKPGDEIVKITKIAE